MTKKEKLNTIETMLYTSINYMYCDNCRFGGEIREEDCTDKSGIKYGCEDCHRKYNGWGISKKEANRLAKLIMELN